VSLRYIIPLDDPRIDSFRRVHAPRVARRLASWLALIFVLVAVALAVVPWQQTAFGEGQVVAYSPTERQQRIDSPVEGWIEEWFVIEGTRVAAGDPIVRLGDPDPERLARLEREREAAQARVAAAEQAVSTAQRNVRRQAALVADGLAAPREYEQAVLRVADANRELASARAELARIETQVARQEQQLVRAPRNGVILRRAAGQGSVYVRPGEELAVLVPEIERRAVELWMDGNDLPLLKVVRQVRMQFEGWPAVQISGWPGIAVVTFGGTIEVIDAADVGPPGTFRILVAPIPGELWPDRRILRQGVRAHGWVLLNVVPLGFELWRQFNDFPPALPEPLLERERGGPYP
jgi:multidrug efflux pump subunit AcrA (membrane-fusion protein)